MIINLTIVSVWILIVILAVPVATFVFELLMACRAHTHAADSVEPAGSRPACAILIPAHDEESNIEKTLSNVLQKIGKDDRVVVIADNCTDATSELASRAGAEVVYRIDPDHRGKGFAMQFGIDAIREDPREVVVFLDADCQFVENSLDHLVWQTKSQGCATQAKYLMRRPDEVDQSMQATISQFAVLIKNWVRPRGLHRLDVPVPLTGSGMGFPWNEISTIPLASANLVEDMTLGCQLAQLGRGARFCEAAEVLAPLPTSSAASRQQRERWEQGHLDTIRKHVPRLLLTAIKHRRISLLAVAFDLAVPPLTFLLFALSMTWLITAVLATVDVKPFVCVTSMLLAMVFALVVSARRFSDDSQLFRALLTIPRYAINKLPIYLSFFFRGRQRQWLRTAR